MKKIIPSGAMVLFALCLTVSCSAGPDTNIPPTAAVHNENTAYNWYCKKTDDNSQPLADSLFSFMENDSLATYYIDKSHSDFDADDKVIYLTFDAGYENGNVEKILDTLKEKEAVGAFFVLENLVLRNTDLVRRMEKEGHLVCNHTATHPDMTAKIGKEAFMEELWRLEDVCADSGITLSNYYRPPEGRFSEQNLRIAADEGYKTVMWSYAYVDWDNNAQPSPEESIKKVLSGTHNGEVILLHPTSATNAQILGDLIDAWRDMGFRFGTLDELTK
ncbi:MAG: delta-lactam-biosynthetic de-N-acetylase [Ruminococcaceae bacterium]|nr:delta-lactam-biosynthetic de-N-acetylase [Oscillospiraceae bacterium]